MRHYNSAGLPTFYWDSFVVNDFNQRVALGYVKFSGLPDARYCKETKFGSAVKIGNDTHPLFKR